MSVFTVEGIVENGQIRLLERVQLPERAKVFVVIPDVIDITLPRGPMRIYSPRLVHPEQAADLQMEVTEEGPMPDVENR